MSRENKARSDERIRRAEWARRIAADQRRAAQQAAETQRIITRRLRSIRAVVSFDETRQAFASRKNSRAIAALAATQADAVKRLTAQQIESDKKLARRLVEAEDRLNRRISKALGGSTLARRLS